MKRSLVAVYALAVVACSSETAGPSGSGGNDAGSGGGVASTSEAISSLPRDTSPAPSSADLQEFETDNAAFAFDLYAALGSGATENLFFSPYSISTAFAMTYAGAAGQTASQMADVMHYTLPPARLGPAFDWLDLQLATRASAETEDEGQPFALHAVNALWGEKTETWVPSFLDTLAVDYGAGMWLTDFTGNPTGALSAINGWVNGQTSGRIPTLLPANAVTSSTLFVIVNALYFEANWAQPFDPTLTLPAPFTRADGSVEMVPTMQQVSGFAYAQGNGYQVVELPYDGYQVAMDIILPAAGADAALDALLTGPGFATILASTTPQQVSLELPRFQVTAPSFSIKSVLQKLGMVAAWGPSADFSAMTPDQVTLTNAFHQTYAKVDEHGTEAAAATGVVGGDGGLPPSPPVVYPMVVNRPFFVAIRDLPTGTILFAGKIVEPNG
jgi:serpin B